MTRLTAKDFAPEILELYDFYAHGMITKREFLDRAGKFAVGGLTAMALLDMLKPNYALAQQVAEEPGAIVPVNSVAEARRILRAQLAAPYSLQQAPAGIAVDSRKAHHAYRVGRAQQRLLRRNDCQRARVIH